MGFFKKAIKAAANPIGSITRGGLKKAGASDKDSKNLGMLADPSGALKEKIIDKITSSKKDDTDKFNPTFVESPGDLDAVRRHVSDIDKFRKADITGPRQAAQLELETLGQEKDKGLADLNATQGGRFETLRQKLQQTGSDRGSEERLARTLGRQGEIGAQDTRGRFDRLASGIRSNDLNTQEGLKDQALFGLPQLAALPASIQANINAKNASIANTAQAGNVRAAALKKAGKSNTLGTIGTIGGTLVGAYFGGPVGAGVGGAAGGQLGNSLGS